MAISSTCDALIVGAGPAGAAAAWALARAGLHVVLADRHSFPRDKVCGDALIPDALGAIDTIGLRPAIDAESARLRELRVYAPSGAHVSLAGDFCCLPRVRFDELLVDAARAAGATIAERMTAVAPLVDRGRVSGAAFTSSSGTADVRASMTLLATGANATAMSAFGLQAPLRPNAVAGRAYFRVPERIASRFQYLCIAYQESLCPGYGWIFPGPDRRFNVGVGFFSRGDGPPRSLRDLWTRFTSTFEPAAALVNGSEQVAEFRGAPIRTGLSNATFGRPGLLAIGESAAMTYPATGEGIGKAMESGLLAARLVAEALSGRRPADDVHQAYEAEFLARHGSRYRAYAIAEACSSRPWLVNYLARRANAGRFVQRELQALVTERGDATRLFSIRGLVTSLFA
jgi:geranylgeranyl reductase family protein